MEYTKGFKKLNLPEYFKFGIEIEANNVKTKGENGLYTGESAKYIKDKNWHMATKKEESLVAEGGAELVSPILHDAEEDWKDISDICEHIKKFPGKNDDKVVADEKCGLHVHFDAEQLLKNPDAMKTFLNIYAESEEILYKMCNEKNNPIRKGAINRDLKGIHFISALWRKGMAAPSGEKILKQIQNGTLKVSYKKFGKLRMLASKYKLDERRYYGLNLTNLGNSKKNTVEFRMANGTLNPEVIKQNVFLYASLINIAIESTKNPEKYQDRLKDFFDTNVNEQQKAENFLNLIIENPKDKRIYMERWESVKNAEVFQKNTSKGFAKNRFKKEQFKEIVARTPYEMVRSAHNYIKEILFNTRDKGVIVDGR